MTEALDKCKQDIEQMEARTREQVEQMEAKCKQDIEYTQNERGRCVALLL